jgi:manganese/zinc/iron transport system permease protein
MSESLIPTGVAWPGFAEVVRVLTLQAGYNTTVVLIGVSLLGAAAGVVGTFAVLRRRALMSDTLSHAALPGICAAFLVAVLLDLDGRSLPVLLTGAAISGVIGTLVVQGVVRATRLPEDAAMGAVLSVFFGLGFVLLSHIQTLGTGAEGGISKFIYGQTAAMSIGEAFTIGLVALAATLAVALLFKEFRLACFDRGFAAAQGWPTSLIDLLMMALVVLVTVIGLRAVGLILIIALIIIPAAAARFWTERLSVMTALAAGIGAASGYLGAAASALFPNFPAGAVIVLTAGVFFVVSMACGPARGLLAASIRHARLRLQVSSQHLLRAMFERLEGGHRTESGGVALADLARARSWSPAWFGFVVRWLTWRGFLVRRGNAVALTDLGHCHALRVTRNHRLFEQFLVTRAELAPSHVDRSADYVEHVLSPEIIAELETELAAVGRLPRYLGVPVSVHPLDDDAPVRPAPAGARP